MSNRVLALFGTLSAVATLACADVLTSVEAPATPEEKGRAISGVFAMNRAACALLLDDKTIPRDDAAERYCRAVLFTDWSKP